MMNQWDRDDTKRLVSDVVIAVAVVFVSKLAEGIFDEVEKRVRQRRARP